MRDTLRLGIPFAAALGLWACGGSSTRPTPVTKDDQSTIQASPEAALTELGTKLAKAIESGDVATIEQLWLTPDLIEPCEITGGKNLTRDKALAYPEEELNRLRDKTIKDLEDKGEVLFVNTWTEPHPNYLGGRLGGEACTATNFGRINVIVKPGDGDPQVIGHRFNAQHFEGGWRLYRYLPERPRCDSPKGKKNLACKKLAGAD
jgi:hypothetical protein